MGRGFAHAVAFHGFDDPEILIGGAAGGYLKQQIAAAIERVVAGSGITVRVAAPGNGFGGDDERNIVNRLSAGGMGGIQIEQSLTARDTTGAPSPTRSPTSTRPRRNRAGRATAQSGRRTNRPCSMPPTITTPKRSTDRSSRRRRTPASSSGG